MQTLTFDLPDLTRQAEHDIRMRVAGTLYEQRLTSTAEGARLVGLPQREFIETMGRYGFSLFSGTSEEYEQDFRVELS